MWLHIICGSILFVVVYDMWLYICDSISYAGVYDLWWYMICGSM